MTFAWTAEAADMKMNAASTITNNFFICFPPLSFPSKKQEDYMPNKDLFKRKLSSFPP
jgi:hypothetical protein